MLDIRLPRVSFEQVFGPARDLTIFEQTHLHLVQSSTEQGHRGAENWLKDLH